MATKNTRILVNFKTKKIVHTRNHRGTPQYQALINNGYEYVGDLKANTGLFFWLPHYFEPQSKFQHNEV